jgi:hypothetical protein
MSEGQGIVQELSFGDVLSRTFEYYRRDFVKYFILFAVVEVIVGVLDTLVQRSIVLPTITQNTVAQQLVGFFGAFIELIALTAIVTLAFVPFAYGGAVKMVSEAVQNGRVDLGASVRLALSRLIWIWVVGVVVAIIVFLGFIVLVVPGIILTIMFSLVLPVIIIEGPGFQSLGRSRKLVSKRWLKTFALLIVFGITIGIAGVIVGLISSLFGVASTVVSSILSALYLPLVPIMLTVYYYSNAARINPPQVSPVAMTSGAAVQSGTMRFCPNCGVQLTSAAMFCPNCGARQTA